MKSKSIVSIISLCLAISLWMHFTTIASAEEYETQIIIDSSRFGSEKLGDTTKLEAVKSLIIDIFGTLKLQSKVALRIYGGKTQDQTKSCENSTLLIPFETINIEKWKEKLAQLKPDGEPTISFAVKAAINDFDATSKLKKNIIIINFSPNTCDTDLSDLNDMINKSGKRIVLQVIDYGADLETRRDLSKPVGFSGGSFFIPLTKSEFKQNILDALDLCSGTGDLMVRTKDSDGNEIYFVYEIIDKQTKKTITRHETNSIKSIKPGNYVVKIKTIPEKIFEDVNIKKDQLSEYSVSEFGQLKIVVLDPSEKETRTHFTIKSTDKDIFYGSGDSGEPIFMLEGKYKLTIHTIPFTNEQIEIIKGKKVMYTVKTLGKMVVELKNIPSTLKKIKGVIRDQKTNKYITSLPIPNTFNMVQGEYKFIIYANKNITKENIVVKPKETTTLSIDLAEEN
jgi:hypothetical protein